MNDWPIRRFIVLSFSLLVILDSVIVLNNLGMSVPLLRQIVGLIIMTFIPGYSILRILRIHNIDRIKSFMFSIGLSLSYTMILGLFLKLLSYRIGYFYPPFTLLKIVIFFNVSTYFLLALAYIRDKDYRNSLTHRINFKLDDYQMLFLIFFLLICVFFSTYVATYYFQYLFQRMILILVIFISFYTAERTIKDKVTCRHRYLLIWLISITLLYHAVLLFPNLWGADINVELAVAKSVFISSNWNVGLASNVNSMASISILPVIYSNISDISLIYIFKAFYPLLFSLVPVCLYNIYKTKFKNFYPILAVLLFIFYFGFYTVMPALARQEIAEFFLVLLIIIIIGPKDIISNFNKTILGTIFLFSFLISHYGSYVFFMFLLGLFLIIEVLLKNKKINYRTFEFSFQFYLLLLGSVLAFFWYYSIGQGSIFKAVIQTFWEGIAAMFQPGYESMEVTVSEAFVSVLKIIESYLNILIILVGVFGIIVFLIKKYKEDPRVQDINSQRFLSREKNIRGIFKRLSNKLITQKKRFMSFIRYKFEISELTIFSIASMMIFSISLISTYGRALAVNRVYHWVLFFITPYCIFGFVVVLSLINRFILKKKILIKTFARIIFVFLIIFFIFSSSLIYYYSQDKSKSGLFTLKNDTNFYSLTPGDICAAEWLKEHNDGHLVTAGAYQWQPLSAVLSNPVLELNTSKYFDFRKNDTYLFLSRANILNQVVTFRTGAYSLNDETLSNLTISKKPIVLDNLIYTSTNPTNIIFMK
jgi:uncharacterized membrane protein